MCSLRLSNWRQLWFCSVYAVRSGYEVYGFVFVRILRKDLTYKQRHKQNPKRVFCDDPKIDLITGMTLYPWISQPGDALYQETTEETQLSSSTVLTKSAANASGS